MTYDRNSNSNILTLVAKIRSSSANYTPALVAEWLTHLAAMCSRA